MSATATLPLVRPASAGTGTATWQLRQLIWLYVILLIFEGALRKWFLPSLATPLLVIRDPVAVLILLRAAFSRYRVLNAYSTVSIGFTIVAIFLALSVGHGNLMVAVFGARITALHFPLIFVIGQVFTRDDVLKMGRFLMWLTPPMVLLAALQFYSPQSAWVNRGLGGDLEGAGFTGAMGFFRPPGTFSFTMGLQLYLDLAAAFAAYFWIGRRQEIGRLLLIAATVALAVAIPISLSRGYVFQVLITMLFLFVASLRSGGSIARIVLFLLTLPFLVALLQQFEFFNQALEVLATRFTLASASEGGVEGTLVERILGGNAGAIARAGLEAPWGYGIGLGTNVGAFLTTGTRHIYLVGENEWERIFGELGLIIGTIALLCRLVLGVHMGVKSFGRLLGKDALPWILLSFAIPQLYFGQWAPPMNLGFGILVPGLLIASLNPSREAR